MTHTGADGRIWRPYEVQYRSPDGAFAFTIMAVSDEHARLLVQDIRATAALAGEVVKEVRT